MNVWLSTGSVHHLDPEVAFWLAPRAGFDGVELLIDGRMAGLGAEVIECYARHHGAPVRGVHAPLNPIPGWGDFWGNVRQAEAWARRLGAAVMTVHPTAPLRWIGRRRARFARRLQGLRDAASRHHITVAIENLPRARTPLKALKRRLATLDSVIDLARDCGVKLTFDTTHLGTWKRDILESFSRADGLVANLHVSDHSPGHQHLLPGRGRLPLKDFLEAARERRYEGAITIEVCPEAFLTDRRERVLRMLADARRTVKRHAGR